MMQINNYVIYILLLMHFDSERMGKYCHVLYLNSHLLGSDRQVIRPHRKYKKNNFRDKKFGSLQSKL